MKTNIGRLRIRKPPEGYREFTVDNKNWQLGALFYDLTGLPLQEIFTNSVWYDRQHFLSIKPGEDWRKVFEVKHGPMTEGEKAHLHCFLSINLHDTPSNPENANV